MVGSGAEAEKDMFLALAGRMVVEEPEGMGTETEEGREMGAEMLAVTGAELVAAEKVVEMVAYSRRGTHSRTQL